MKTSKVHWLLQQTSIETNRFFMVYDFCSAKEWNHWLALWRQVQLPVHLCICLPKNSFYQTMCTKWCVERICPLILPEIFKIGCENICIVATFCLVNACEGSMLMSVLCVISSERHQRTKEVFAKSNRTTGCWAASAASNCLPGNCWH